MKCMTLILILLAMPAFADRCRFSKSIKPKTEAGVVLSAEHYSVDIKDCSSSATVCSHVLICGEEVKPVVCPQVSGKCDGYSADTCLAHALTSTDAKFATDKGPPALGGH